MCERPGICCGGKGKKPVCENIPGADKRGPRYPTIKGYDLVEFPSRVIDHKAHQPPMLESDVSPTAWEAYPHLAGKAATLCDFKGGQACCDKTDQACGVHNPHKDITSKPATFPLHKGTKMCQWVAPQQGMAMCDRMAPKQTPLPHMEPFLQSETGRGGFRETFLNYPHYLDARGSEIVVSERDTSRVQFLQQQGGRSRVQPYGYWGSGYGVLNRPSGVAFVDSGSCYVVTADTGNHRLSFLSMRMDDHGYGHCSEIHTAGTGVLHSPTGLYHDRFRQSFYVTDVGYNDPKVTYHDLDGRIISTFRPCATNPMLNPTDVACDVHGRAFVTDSFSNTVSCFDRNGKYLFHFGSPGKDESQFNQPSGVTVDRRGNIMVSDLINNRIHMFSPDGRFMRFVTTDSYLPRGLCESRHGLLAVCTGDPYAHLKFFYLYPWEGN